MALLILPDRSLCLGRCWGGYWLFQTQGQSFPLCTRGTETTSRATPLQNLHTVRLMKIKHKKGNPPSLFTLSEAMNSSHHTQFSWLHYYSRCYAHGLIMPDPSTVHHCKQEPVHIPWTLNCFMTHHSTYISSAFSLHLGFAHFALAVLVFSPLVYWAMPLHASGPLHLHFFSLILGKLLPDFLDYYFMSSLKFLWAHIQLKLIIYWGNYLFSVSLSCWPVNSIRVDSVFLETKKDAKCQRS